MKGLNLDHLFVFCCCQHNVNVELSDAEKNMCVLFEQNEDVMEIDNQSNEYMIVFVTSG